MIKKIKSTLLLLILVILSINFSCQSEGSKKAVEAKADSLEEHTKKAMDSAYDASLKQMNSVSDSEIINDPAAPKK